MNGNTLNKQAFKLKGRLYTLTVVSLLDGRPEQFKSQLLDVINQAPNMFNNAPVVLDFNELKNQSTDLQALCRIIKEFGLVPVAVQGGDSLLNTLAQTQGLAILNASSNHDKPISNDETAQKQDKKSTQNIDKNKLVTQPVRSGQQLVSQGDLTITSSVSNGAELLADGNIHVYGPLRGRALAGISGQKTCRIFCQTLEAELVSIAGYYKLSDGIPHHQGPCQIFLKDDQVVIEPL